MSSNKYNSLETHVGDGSERKDVVVDITPIKECEVEFKSAFKSVKEFFSLKDMILVSITSKILGDFADNMVPKWTNFAYCVKGSNTHRFDEIPSDKPYICVYSKCVRNRQKWNVKQLKKIANDSCYIWMPYSEYRRYNRYWVYMNMGTGSR